MRNILSALLLMFLLGLPVSSAAGQEGSTILGDPDLASGTADLKTITPNFTGCTKVLANPVNSAYEQEIVYLTNVERQKVGAAPLKRNVDLDYAARYHAKDLIDDNYFDHPTFDGWGDGVDGVTYVCSTSTRIALYYAGYRGENIAGGYGTPASVMVDGWMKSSGHRSNLLNPGHREIGVGYYSGGYWRNYWVQDFGTRNDVYPLVINLEAQQTDNFQVSLYVYGLGTFTQMRLKNDTDAWGPWISFASSLNWNLHQVRGTRTVTVELKKPDGSTTTSSDTIYLTNGAQLGGLPASINFVYDLAVGQFKPSQVTLQPQNIGGTLPMTWAATGSESWVRLSLTGGTTPSGATQISILGINTSVPGVYTSSVTIAVTEPLGAQSSPQVIPVRVVVTELDNFTFLPLLRR